MSPIRLIVASLEHHWRIHVAVALGVAAGTAVLTGALLVGDSMRGSLRTLTLERLGRIDEVLAPGPFFRAKLANELAAASQFSEHFTAAVPAILLPASLENPSLDPPRRANQIHLVGCDDRFWKLAEKGISPISAKHPEGRRQSDPGKLDLSPFPRPREIVLNRPLAEQLKVDEGDDVVLRLPRIGAIPADSPLGRKSETLSSHRLTVSRIIPAEGLGKFALAPTQHQALDAFVPIDWLADRLGEPGRSNAILVAGGRADEVPSPESESSLQSMLAPTLEDYAIRVEKTGRGYFNVTSDRMLLDPRTQTAMLAALAGRDVQPALAYLANTIACGKREIPYSIIAAVDFQDRPPLGPLVDVAGRPIGPLGEGQIVLNRWAADQLGATPGQTVRVTYFEPESTDGQVREKTAEFRLAAIAELTGAADDPDFTPEVRGVTDKVSMADWNPPFPFDAGRIRPQDEKYWDEHRATPKAFVSLATGRRLWASRFGNTTSLRVRPEEGMTAESLAKQLRPGAAAMGFVFQPVKRQGLAASKGTTSFEGLFLGFSFFIIAAAVMLVVLLFRLGIDSRATEVGILLAVGLRRRQVARMLAAEGFVVAALASLLGVAAGVGYAALMLAGLRTWWLAAVVTPFLRLSVEPQSLAIGYLAGVGVALAAIVWAVRRAGALPVRRLLAGQVGDEPAVGPRPPGPGTRVRVRRAWPLIFLRRGSMLPWAMLLAAAALGLAAAGLEAEAQAGAFFGAGALVLTALLMLLARRLRRGATGPAIAASSGNLLRLAVRNAARNPGRSTLTIGLVASACFLIVSVGAFQADPSSQAPARHSGNGGFSLWAQSAQPIYHDLNTDAGRAQLGFSEEDRRTLEHSAVYSLRVKPGEDASCLNLYKPRQPTVLGVPEALIARGGFAFAASQAKTDAERQNPWLLLNSPLPLGEGQGMRASAARTPSSKPTSKPSVSPSALTPTLSRRGRVKTPRPSATALENVPVPAIVDDVTAKYSLHLGLGDSLPIDDGRGHSATLVIVGLLKTSIFQGNLLVSEQNLLAHFPDTNGFRTFLVESPPAQVEAVEQSLNRGLGDYGLAVETTGQRLAGFLVVQNTYLSTFQTLGGLGLILGTFGLAAVELRNVLERRGELALLRATGFRRRMLAELVMLENSLLLAAGLGCGLVAALVAVLPHLLGSGPSSAAIPWGTLAVTLALVILAGTIAGLAAVRAVLAAPLLEALRDE